MTTRPTRNSVAYVRYRNGKEPNRIRAWPQASPGTIELPEGRRVGKAPELSALLVLDVAQDTIQVGSTTKTFHNPHTDSQGRVWWYVRAYDQDSKTVVQGWTAENEGAVIYLAALQPIESCNAATAEAPGMRWRPSNLQADMEAFVVSKTVLNVRRGPDCDTGDVGDLTTGMVIKVLEGPRCSADGRVWWRIKHNGNDRWVCESEPAGTTCANTPANADDNPLEWNLLPMRVALQSR